MARVTQVVRATGVIRVSYFVVLRPLLVEPPLLLVLDLAIIDDQKALPHVLTLQAGWADQPVQRIDRSKQPSVATTDAKFGGNLPLLVGAPPPDPNLGE